MGRYGCVLQAMIMMLLALVAMAFYEYGQVLPGAVVAAVALGVMAWGLWIVNHKSSGD